MDVIYGTILLENYFSKFSLLTKYLNIQNATSTMLRMLIPVKSPRIPPKPESLSKKLNLLLLTVTDTVSVASLKVISALKAKYFCLKESFQLSSITVDLQKARWEILMNSSLTEIRGFRTLIEIEGSGSCYELRGKLIVVEFLEY